MYRNIYPVVLVTLMFASGQLEALRIGSTNDTYQDSGRVRDGTIISPHSMPWLVRLRGLDLCTGSIIGKRHVLSAAHCSNPTYVAVGAHDLNEVGHIGRYIKVDKVEVYTDNGFKVRGFEDVAYDRDIAIITLSEDVLQDDDLNVSKAILGAPSETDCKDCKGTCAGLYDASGWGIDPINSGTWNYPKTTTKQCVSCNYENDVNTCAESNVDPYHFDVCGGDSGGPLTKSETNVIVGIVERGVSCYNTVGFRRVGIYVDLLKPDVQKLIREVVPDLSTEQSTTPSTTIPTDTTTRTPTPGKCNPNFVDLDGDTCQTYVDNNWCTAAGDYGGGWDDEWGTFEDWANNGETATVCPQCGCNEECDDKWSTKRCEKLKKKGKCGKKKVAGKCKKTCDLCDD